MNSDSIFWQPTIYLKVTITRYYGNYSNRSRGARKQVEQEQGATLPTSINESPVDARRKANWARLIQQVYEIDLLECPNCSATMRIIALIRIYWPLLANR